MSTTVYETEKKYEAPPGTAVPQLDSLPSVGTLAVLLLLRLNHPLYQFFAQKRGGVFSLRTIPLHWFYYLYNGVSFALGMFLHWRDLIGLTLTRICQPIARSLPIGFLLLLATGLRFHALA